ncbi:MAG TPA: methyltransferase domain-containing protein [Dehalococcoidia bacterium]|nr:methyltransferase domain-containing protein [Dehalococcoidia bacterium]
MRRRLRAVPVLGPLARAVQRTIANSDWLDWIGEEIRELRRNEQRAADRTEERMRLIENQLQELADRMGPDVSDSVARALERGPHDPGLAAVLVGLADLSTPWAGNYTKAVDEEYVQANYRHHKPVFDLVEKLAGKAAPGRPPRILEVGMGLGTMCILLSRRNFEVTGIDQDALQVARAKQLCRRLGGFARYLCMDLFDLGMLQANSFDVAFSQGTLEHLGPSEVVRALQVQLHVAPYVVFSVPSVDWPGKEVGDERRLTTEEWDTTIRAAGLEPLSLEYYGDARWHVLAAIGRPS